MTSIPPNWLPPPPDPLSGKPFDAESEGVSPEDRQRFQTPVGKPRHRFGHGVFWFLAYTGVGFLIAMILYSVISGDGFDFF